MTSVTGSVTRRRQPPGRAASPAASPTGNGRNHTPAAAPNPAAAAPAAVASNHSATGSR